MSQPETSDSVQLISGSKKPDISNCIFCRKVKYRQGYIRS